MPKTYSVAEAAQAAGVETSTLERWIRKYNLPEAIPVVQGGSTTHLFDETGIETLKGRIQEREINGKRIKFFSDKSKVELGKAKKRARSKPKQLTLPLDEKSVAPVAQADLPPITKEELVQKISRPLSGDRMNIFLSRMPQKERDEVETAVKTRPVLVSLMAIQINLADEVNPLVIEGAIEKSGLVGEKIGRRVFYDKYAFAEWYLSLRGKIAPNSPWLTDPIVDAKNLPLATPKEIEMAVRGIPQGSKDAVSGALRSGSFTPEILAARLGLATTAIRAWAKNATNKNSMINVGNRWVVYLPPLVAEIVAKVNQKKLDHQNAIRKLLNPPTMKPSIPPPAPVPEKAEGFNERTHKHVARHQGRRMMEFALQSLDEPELRSQLKEFVRGLAEGLDHAAHLEIVGKKEAR